MSSDSSSNTSHTDTSDDESQTSETSHASATSGTTQEFCIQLITYMNTKLDINCDIDNIELQKKDDNSGPEIYKVSEYTIIRFPTNSANTEHRCFIWDSNSYFLVDLTTDRALINIFSTKSVGKLVNAILRQGEPSDSQPAKLKLLFKGIPEKSDEDLPQGKFDILAEPYYYKIDYTLDFDQEEIQMKYIPGSANTYSYPNDSRPELK